MLTYHFYNKAYNKNKMHVDKDLAREHEVKESGNSI
jgi:hypothetical protein